MSLKYICLLLAFALSVVVATVTQPAQAYDTIGPAQPKDVPDGQAQEHGPVFDPPRQLQVHSSLQLQAGQHPDNSDASTPPQGQSMADHCHYVHYQDTAPIYKNLKRVNVSIEFPADLKEALDCTGHEQQCASHDAQGVPDAEHYIQNQVGRFKALTEGYPKALYPENLKSHFRSMVMEGFNPVLPRDGACTDPEPSFLHPHWPDHAFHTTIDDPDVFNFTVGVTLVTSTTPHMLILSTTAFRLGFSEYEYSVPRTTYISFDLPDQALNDELNKYVQIIAKRLKPNNAVPVPPNWEDRGLVLPKPIPQPIQPQSLH